MRQIVGVMEARVTPDGAAAAAKVVDLSLAKGDVVRWRFTFRAFPAMNPFDTFLLIGATSRPGPDY